VVDPVYAGLEVSEGELVIPQPAQITRSLIGGLVMGGSLKLLPYPMLQTVAFIGGLVMGGRLSPSVSAAFRGGLVMGGRLIGSPVIDFRGGLVMGGSVAQSGIAKSFYGGLRFGGAITASAISAPFRGGVVFGGSILQGEDVAAYVAAQMPGVPATQRQAVADAALAAATAIGGSTTQYNVIDTLVARVYNWLVFRPGATFQDNAGTVIAVAGDPVARVNPWIGSIYTTVFSNSNRPTLTTTTGATFNGSSHYLIGSTATYPLAACYITARKPDSLFGAGQGAAVLSMRPGNLDKPGSLASNETQLYSGVGLQGSGQPTATNKVAFFAASAGEINGTTVSAAALGDFLQGVELPNATGYNLTYAALPTASGVKTPLIGTDTFSGNVGQGYWKGGIGDLMFLSSVPSATEKTRITAFLKAFWSIA
jgi:hypothetical protein